MVQGCRRKVQLLLPPGKGWERNFVLKKFRGIDSERFPLFRGRKCSFRGITRSTEESFPTKKNLFYRTAKKLNKMSSPYLKSCLFWHFFEFFESFLFQAHRMESVFFCKMLWNNICFVSLLLFLFHGLELRVVFSSEERIETEFRNFSIPRNRWNSNPTPPGLCFKLLMTTST